VYFANRLLGVGSMMQYAKRIDQIEARVGERKILGIAVQVRSVEAGVCQARPCQTAARKIVIQRYHAIARALPLQRVDANPAADFEHELAGMLRKTDRVLENRLVP